MKKTVSCLTKKVNVFFHLLTQCNLACFHCYINPDHHGYISVDRNKIILWLELFSERAESPNVIFLGGEPTMHPNLSFAVKKAKSLGYNSVTIDTNGYRVAEILSDIKPEDVDFFSFSLDGPTAQSNDRLRGNGSYDSCVKAIFEAKKKGFNASLIFTVSSANFMYLHKMPELLSTLGIDHFFIQTIGVRGRWTQIHEMRKMLKQVNDVLWLETIPRIAQEVVNQGIAVTYPKVFLRPEDTFECGGIVSNNYFVFPNGRVYQCPLCEDYPLHGKKIEGDKLIDTGGINETALFALDIPEGCVMNKIIQPDNICYHADGRIKYRIACCMLKEELIP